MNYAWIITEDHIDSDSVDVIGPGGAPDSLTRRLTQGEGIGFKMYDDDGEHYYTGRILFDQSWAYGPDLPDEAFGPLDDFGTPNAGATEIRYAVTGWKPL